MRLNELYMNNLIELIEIGKTGCMILSSKRQLKGMAKNEQKF